MSDKSKLLLSIKFLPQYIQLVIYKTRYILNSFIVKTNIRKNFKITIKILIM